MTKTLDEIYELFEKKMTMVKEVNGVHPKVKLMLMVGPEVAEKYYAQLRVVFLSGYSEGMLDEAKRIS